MLHDQLLQRFADDPTLTPKDVVVMVSDINRYGPYIQAVFGSISGERAIPYSISDCAATQENPLLQSFLMLLAFTGSALYHQRSCLELLARAGIVTSFRAGGDDLTTLRRWAQESGVRWG